MEVYLSIQRLLYFWALQRRPGAVRPYRVLTAFPPRPSASRFQHSFCLVGVEYLHNEESEMSCGGVPGGNAVQSSSVQLQHLGSWASVVFRLKQTSRLKPVLASAAKLREPCYDPRACF